MADLNPVQFASDLPKQSQINIGHGALYRLARSGQPRQANNYVEGRDARPALKNMGVVRKNLTPGLDLGSARPTGRSRKDYGPGY